MLKRNVFSTRNPNQRQLRVGELLRRNLAQILYQGFYNSNDNVIQDNNAITIGEVRLTPDLKRAYIYVLPLGGRNAEETIAMLNQNKKQIRRVLNKTVSLKFSPELHFMIDSTFDAMDKMRRLLSQENVQRDITQQAFKAK